MKKYDHKKIEKKWQEKWEEANAFAASEDPEKKKYYVLIEFPYPSGDGLHVGHVRSYTALDVVARKRRREGYSVLYPIGWDAFGLPTENYAIKTGVHPKEVTKKNTDNFRRQLKAIGFSFDWNREINTSHPEYYRWTQWIFLRLFEAGLAYKAKTLINWCLNCKIGLANEEVVEGRCERCGGETEKREKEQWMLRITEYAERLLSDLDTVDYLEKIKAAQRNWIGKNEGWEIDFKLAGLKEKICVFTTRPDTLFGATYMVLAPEHPLLKDGALPISNKEEIEKYVSEARKRTEIERTAEGKNKTGVELKGVKAINPATKEEIPVWVADYVLGHYGTGAIMAVPVHDERDFAFAKKFNLPLRQVVAPVFRQTAGGDALREGVPFVPRDAVMCVVKHWEKDEYLCLTWRNYPEVRSFVSGGIEPGEDPIDAGKREILEESGYKNPKFIRQLGGFSFIEFFHQIKKVNIRARFRYLYFELENGEQDQVSATEANIHEVFWKKADEVKDFLSLLEREAVWKRVRGEEDLAPFSGEGYLVNSAEFDGLPSEEAKEKVAQSVGGRKKVAYKLRDWVFSRQRYWGEPIPMIFCERDGWVPVADKDLPVELPDVKNYKPTDTGESPLSGIGEWVETTCPKCGGEAKRETDVMPNWAGSSWYYLRYCDPHNSKEFASKEKLDYWSGFNPTLHASRFTLEAGPVDWYNGGMEHTTLHLLYSRFWHKFLYDQKLLPTPEPYAKRTSHGIVLAEDGTKMSKSKGNVINPDEVVDRLGADTLRLYELFMGPFEQMIPWSADSMIGCRKFIEKVWRQQEKIADDASSTTNVRLETLLHQTIKKVGEDIEAMKFNTAMSAMMIFANALEKESSIEKTMYHMFLQLLAPFAPHAAEELWEATGGRGSVHDGRWPVFDPKKIQADTVRLAVQVNGKVRGEMEAKAAASEEEVRSTASALPEIDKWLAGHEIRKTVYVPGRLINFVLDGP